MRLILAAFTLASLVPPAFGDAFFALTGLGEFALRGLGDAGLGEADIVGFAFGILRAAPTARGKAAPFGASFLSVDGKRRSARIRMKLGTCRCV